MKHALHNQLQPPWPFESVEIIRESKPDPQPEPPFPGRTRLVGPQGQSWLDCPCLPCQLAWSAWTSGAHLRDLS